MTELATVIAHISPGCTSAITANLKDYYVNHSSLIIPHDWEINIYSAKLGGLYFYNEPLIGYGIHPNNTIGIKYCSPELKKFFKVNCKNEDNHLTKDLAIFFSSYYQRTNDKNINDYIDGLINYCKNLK